MKKPAGILFMVAIAIPLLIPAWFLVQQQSLRQTAKENLKRNYLQTIRVSRHDLIWVKKNKEIRVNGHLFDVQQLMDNGDHFIITGLYDTQEDLLHKQLEKWQQGQDKHKNQMLSAVFMQLLYSEKKESFCLNIPRRPAPDYNEYYIRKLEAPFIRLIPLPPDC